MACITSLEQNRDRTWSGRSVKTGETRKFLTLNDYTQYVKSLENQGRFCAEPEKQYLPNYKPGASSVRTGFLEFAPQNLERHSKYSAIDPKWEGVASSHAAIARGEYDLDTGTMKQVQPKVATSTGMDMTTNCSIQ